MNNRLVHDCAVATTTVLMEILENVLRPEDRLDAYSELYIAVKAGIESYETMRERMERRLNPTKN